MKRALLFALSLFCASAFATDVYVSVTYTPGAAAYEAAHSTNVPGAVASCISGTQGAFDASGIGISLKVYAGAAISPLPDSADMNSQLRWTENSIGSLTAKAGWGPPSPDYGGSSIAIAVSDPGPGVPGMRETALPTSSKTAAASVPVRDLCNQMERAISSIIGATPGYGARLKIYPYQGGLPFCLHTREGTQTDPATLVPDPSPLYTVYFTGYAYTGAPTAALSCDTFFSQQISNGCSSAYCSTHAITGTLPSSAQCAIYLSSGGIYISPAITYTTPTTSSTVTCTDIVDARYSSPGLSNSGHPIGTTGTDSVTAMNNRAVAVSAWRFSAVSLLAAAKDVSWLAATWNQLMH